MEVLQPVENEELPKLLFSDRLQIFIDDKTNPRTKELYRCTLNRMKAFTNIQELTFEDITVKWLKAFDNFLALTAPLKMQEIYIFEI